MKLTKACTLRGTVAMDAWVSSRRCNANHLPTTSTPPREGVKNTVGNDEFAFQDTRLPLASRLVADQPCDRLAPPGDDHFLARLDLCQQAGKLRLGLMDIGHGHGFGPAGGSC